MQCLMSGQALLYIVGMTNDQLINAVSRACEILGGATSLARALGVSPQMVSQWLKGTRPVAAEHCPVIEKLTDGAVRCEELNDKVDWEYVRRTYPTKGNGS